MVSWAWKGSEFRKGWVLFPREMRAFGTPLSRWVNTAWLGWRILYHLGFAGPPGPPVTVGGPRGLCTSLYWPYCFLLSLRFPARTWDTMDTETIEQDAKLLPSPFCPLFPPFGECIVTIHVNKIKKQWDHTWDLFFEKRKKNPTTSS